MKNAPINPRMLDEIRRKVAMDEAKKLANKQKALEAKKESVRVSLSGMTNSGWVTVYTNQVPYELDVLRTNLYEKTDLGWFIATVLGTGLGNPLFAVGFPCLPISPPGMSVTVGPGVIYYFDLLLPTSYSVIPADTNPDHQIYKSYISFDTQTFATPAPVTPGDSIIYLIQGANESQDVNVVSRPYFNSADPSVPIFESQSDTLLNFTNLAVKPGVAASSPTPPTPDAGYTALYYVTVAYGQTSIVSGNITVVPGAPFITESLTQKISMAFVDANLVTIPQAQNNAVIYAPDIGTVNTLVANPTPAYGTLLAGTGAYIIAANTNTGASTLNWSGSGPINIQLNTDSGFAALSGGEIQSGAAYQLIYSGSIWQLMNPAFTSGTSVISVGQIVAQAGTTPDAGFLALSSTPVSRTTYAALFARIGVNWGMGDGSTTFGIPPPGLVWVGAGWGGYTGLSDAVGDTGGEAAHALTSSENGAHAHGPTFETYFLVSNSGSNNISTAGGGSLNTVAGVTLTATSGSGVAHNNIQPSGVVLYQIKY